MGGVAAAAAGSRWGGPGESGEEWKGQGEGDCEDEEEGEFGSGTVGTT